MNTRTAVFSKQELLDELRNTLFVYARELARIYDPRCVPGLLGFSREECPDASRLYDEGLINKVDVNSFGATKHICDLYDYGILGVLYTDLRDDWAVIEEDTKAFFDGLHQSDFLQNNASDYSMDKCREVIKMSCLRYTLDEEGYSVLDDGNVLWGHLTLKDLADLAGIDEKTIRNLANPKAKNPLRTVKHGSRTFVTVEVAKEWLRNRGFKETEVRARSTERDLSVTGFISQADLAAYIALRQARLQLTDDELARRFEKPDVFVAFRDALAQGRGHFEAAFMYRLATQLEVEPGPFVLAALNLFQRDEALKVEAMLKQGETPPDWGTW